MILYKSLLHLYPRSFRAEYGDEMCAIFAQRRGRIRGLRPLAALWLESVADVVANAARVHGDLLRQDLRDAARTCRRAPGFAATVLLVAALGIGATTASFAVADHVLVRPLPFPESDRLVRMWQDQAFRGYPRMELSPSNFLDWKRMAVSVESMAAYTTRSANLVGQREPERLDAARVSAGLFAVLRVQAALGRTLVSADEALSTTPAVVLSEPLWRATFGGDRGVIGRTIVLDDEPHVIVGVMPARFEFPTRDVEIWTALRFTAQDLEDRSDTYLNVVARMKDGATLEEVQSEMRLVAAQLERSFPKENARTSATVVRLRDQVSAQARTLLLTLVAASLGMLLIACANLASLLVARALSREQELAIRAQIGANRDRLVRQALTESLVLAGAGGVLGIALALAAVPLVAQLVPTTLPLPETPGVDLRLLAVAALVTLGTAAGFGLLPARRLSRSFDAGLRHGARAGTSRGTERIRSALVAIEVMVSVVLLVASGLLTRAMWRVQQIDPGFRAAHVLTLQTALPLPRYAQTARRQQFYDRVVGEIEALPGVARAAYISYLPMTMRGGIWPVSLDIAALSEKARQSWAPDPTETRMASLRFVTPGLFDTLGIPLLRGRDVHAGDTIHARRVAIVSASFAREHWPDRDPLGQQFFIAFDTRTVVGVVGDVRVRGLERQSEPQVYLPATQMADNALIGYVPRDLAIRASVPPASLATLVREIIARADPQQPVSNVRLLSDLVDQDTASRRAQVRVLAGFTATAFLLAGIGLYGLLAFAVASRTREIGLRMALGARQGQILRLVLRRGLLLAAVGVGAGALLALAAGRWLQSLLAGVSPSDPPAFAGAIGLVLVVTVLASLRPAFRAARVDPAAAILDDGR